MRQFIAFTKKEILQAARSGKLLILGILFCLFGIMNPAIAKLTPWLFELMAEELAESGVVMNAVTVDALTSWAQFFKNMPIVLMVFLVMFGGHLTEEYQKGTLIHVLTKGLKRHTVMLSKMTVAAALWTAGYWLSFAITWGYNAFFWDNSVARNMGFSVFALYLVGLWLISVIYPASGLLKSTPAVILTVGGAYGVSFILGLFPKVREFAPTYLMNSNDLLLGKIGPADCLFALLLTAALLLLNIAVSVLVFNKKQL